MVSSNLDILNRGNKPTSMISVEEVINLTLGTNHIGNLARDWHVSGELSIRSQINTFPSKESKGGKNHLL